MSSRRRAPAHLTLRSSLAILLGVLAFEPVRANEQFTGKVIGVSDGDTIAILRDRAPVRVRLDGIDYPEGGQDVGQRAKQFTSEAVFGKIVSAAREYS